MCILSIEVHIKSQEKSSPNYASHIQGLRKKPLENLY